MKVISAIPVAFYFTKLQPIPQGRSTNNNSDDVTIWGASPGTSFASLHIDQIQILFPINEQFAAEDLTVRRLKTKSTDMREEASDPDFSARIVANVPMKRYRPQMCLKKVNNDMLCDLT